VNMTASYKNAELPISIYTTSDNSGAQQSRNHYQVGFPTAAECNLLQLRSLRFHQIPRVTRLSGW